MKAEGLRPNVRDLLPLSAFAMLAFADLPSRVPVGPTTGLGAFTVVLLGASIIALMLRPQIPLRQGGATLGFAATLLLVLISFSRGGLSFPALQGTLVWTGVFLLYLVSLRESGKRPDFARRALAALVTAEFILLGLYLPTLLIEGVAATRFLGAPTAALCWTLAAAYFAARWHYGSRAALLLFGLFVGTMLLSVSRMPVGASIVVLALAAYLKPGLRLRVVRIVAIGIIVAGIGYLALTWEPLQEATFRGDQGVRVGGLTLNTTGRAAFFLYMWDSLRTSPWVGHGVGSSVELFDRTGWPIEQPHNDYLRLLHDFGAIGFTVWMVAFALIGTALYRRWRDADRMGSAEEFRVLHLTAFLGFCAFLLSMLTDNPVVYAFYVFPLAVLIGASLGVKAGQE